MADVLAVREDLGEVLGAEDVAEGGLGEQSRGSVSVLDVRHGDGGVRHPVIDDPARPRTPSPSLSTDRRHWEERRLRIELFCVVWDVKDINRYVLLRCRVTKTCSCRSSVRIFSPLSIPLFL